MCIMVIKTGKVVYLLTRSVTKTFIFAEDNRFLFA